MARGNGGSGPRTRTAVAPAAPSVSRADAEGGRQSRGIHGGRVNQDGETTTVHEFARYVYDRLGNVTQSAVSTDDAPTNLARTTSYEYDANERKRTEIDPNTLGQRWSYDYFGRLVGRSDFQRDAVSRSGVDRARSVEVCCDEGDLIVFNRVSLNSGAGNALPTPRSA